MNWVNSGSDNGLSPIRRQAISWINNQYWIIVNWTLRNKLRWNIDAKLSIHKNVFENVVCEMAAILFRGAELTYGVIMLFSDMLHMWYYGQRFRTAFVQLSVYMFLYLYKSLSIPGFDFPSEHRYSCGNIWLLWSYCGIQSKPCMLYMLMPLRIK